MPGPKAEERPHAFVERANVPFNLARPIGATGNTPMEVPVQRREAPPECAVCGKPRADAAHLESEREAQAEELHWPVD